MHLRDYQKEIFQKLTASYTNDLVQLDTGAGKTPIEAALAAHYDNVIVIAHRNTLIEQCSEKLAAFGVYHNVIASKFTKKVCSFAHQRRHKNIFLSSGVGKYVASIDSIISRHKRGLLKIDVEKEWVIIIDEAHHAVTKNKWGSLSTIFQNCRIIGFTATPARTDGGSLSSGGGGVFDLLVQAEGLKTDSVVKLIKRGFLSSFKVYAPETKYIEALKNAQSFLNRNFEMAAAGDAVKYYKKFAHGFSAVIMCPRILNAEEISRRFISAGISSAAISSKMPQHKIEMIKSAFERKEFKVLCNVDMVSEGFDLPSLSAIIMLRKTSSLVAYRQWVGRTLRKDSEKENAIIIDLVGNIAEHGMPDDHIEWDIKNPPTCVKKLTYAPCSKCGFFYKITLKNCTECGAKNTLLERSLEGSRYISIHNINSAVVEHARREIKIKEEREAFEKEIVMPYCSTGISEVLNRSIEKVRVWFVGALRDAGEPPVVINDFLRKRPQIGAEFWMKNFTIKDVSKNNTKKALKVFLRWGK